DGAGMPLGERIRLDHGKSSVAHNSCFVLVLYCFRVANVVHSAQQLLLGHWDLILPLCSRFIMSPIEEIYPLLTQPKRVVIIMHQKPDADAMGSSLGLYHFLRGLGHQPTVISPTNWAEWLKWMPGCEDVIDYEFTTEKAIAVLEQAE